MNGTCVLGHRPANKFLNRPIPLTLKVTISRTAISDIVVREQVINDPNFFELYHPKPLDQQSLQAYVTPTPLTKAGTGQCAHALNQSASCTKSGQAWKTQLPTENTITCFTSLTRTKQASEPLAQLVERLTFNQDVESSNLSGLTIFFALSPGG